MIAAKTAFWHDLYRSLKDQPFLLMESTPSLVNWKPYNKTKAPGLDVLSSIQAVAHGSDSVQYFQWRKSRGASEKFHGAVVGHDGSSSHRVFQSVRKTGEILKKIDAICGTRVEAKAAVIFSWENMWALDNCQGYANAGKGYYETCYAYPRVLWEMGIDCDVVSPKADLSRYALVVAPMLYLTDRPIIDNLRRFVENGGTLYGTYMLGTVNETDLCWLGGIPAEELKEVFGITAQEIDTLYPGDGQQVTLCGEKHEAVDYCEVLEPDGAQTLAVYADGWMAGTPAVTVNRYGKGRAIYQACRDTGSLKRELLSAVAAQAGLAGNILEHPYGVTAHSRTDGEHTYIFVENYLDQPAAVTLRCPMENMLTGETEQHITLPGYGFGVYKR